MPFPLDSTFEARRDSGRWGDAHLVDLYCVDGVGDPNPIRLCDRVEDLTYPADDDVDGSSDVTYQAMESRMRIDRNIRFQQTLATDPCKIYFDAAAAGDGDDPVGRFYDTPWHQLRCRIRQITFDADTGATPSDPVWQWVGRMDFRQNIRQGQEANQLVLTAQGGLFRIRGRNMKTRTHADQQNRLAGDLFFQDLPKMVGITLNFGKKSVELGGTGRGSGNSPSPHGRTELE